MQVCPTLGRLKDLTMGENEDMQEEEQYEERRSGGKWHLEKSISVTHIFTTITAVVSLVIFGSHVDTRLSILERESIYKTQVDQRQQSDIDNDRHDVKSDLKNINDKLDRLIEGKGERHGY